MNLSQLLKTTRQYFWNLDFDEVEVPYLNSSLPLEPNIYSFETVWRHTKAKFYLPTSPEFALKKHLSVTRRNCFAISHCFRDLETENDLHTKEFLMLEWYEVNKNYSDLMISVEQYLGQFGLKPPFLRFQLPKHLPDNEPDFNQFFLNKIEPKLPKRPVFITGYPAFLSPLAQTNTTNGEVNSFQERNERVAQGGQPEGSEHRQNSFTSQSALRFELYVNGIEIANGCTENRNPSSIKSAFETENRYRLDHHLPIHPYSREFIDLSSKLPPSSGVGLGLDRLLDILNP